jgi:hypothetical protein
MNAEGVHELQPRVDARSAATLGSALARTGAVANAFAYLKKEISNYE